MPITVHLTEGVLCHRCFWNEEASFFAETLMNKVHISHFMWNCEVILLLEKMSGVPRKNPGSSSAYLSPEVPTISSVSCRDGQIPFQERG